MQMREKQIFNKLVRDRIPEIIKADGGIPKIRILSEREYRIELLKKLVEESEEALKASGSKKELIKEIGDVQEVIEALVEANGLDPEEISRIKAERKLKRGAFEQRIFLDEVENSNYN
jgi:predicted house-cleaning noncanonical NTP pyrophosphatase (MazG superfamily)